MDETPDSALDDLAELCGIESEFVAADGEVRRISVATKRKVLAAMGVPVGTAHQLAESLRRLEDEEWAQILPPVCVAQRARGPAAIEVIVPAGRRRLTWTITLENGEVRPGEAYLDTLTLLAKRTIGGRVVEKFRLLVDPATLPDGYHKLTLDRHGASTSLIVSPGLCWLPPEIASGSKIWGISSQLYSLRSDHNWGIGDFSDLRELMTLVAARGGDVVGVNPLHALHLTEPIQPSPYSPTSRSLLNVLNIDVQRIPELERCEEARQIVSSPEFRHHLHECRQAALIDYGAVARLKLPVLKRLFAAFCARGDSHRLEAFARFRAAQPRAFELACRFQVLQHREVSTGGSADWRTWPADLRDPHSVAVASFVAAHESEIAEAAWLQWIADEQLRSAAARGKDMAVGLYCDLAVGVDAASAEVWSDPAVFALDARIGAPPDLHNTDGQNWGLPPWNPRALRAQAYRPFIDIIRANMRHAGALRIDHAMGLHRLYWIPDGESPTDGAYVRYPLEDLLGILALESERQQCLLVGEDLGTVPAGFRERMARSRVLSYRILFFEREAQTERFVPPDQYPYLALATVGNHDLPTLRGWWESADEKDRMRLLSALGARSPLEVQAFGDWQARVEPVYGFLGRSSAAIAMAQIEDLSGERDPMNVPGTTDEYPNWRRRLSMSLEEVARADTFAAVERALRATRS